MGKKMNIVHVGGESGAVKVVIADPKRTYLGLYSQTGNCVVSIGEGVHATLAVTIAQGNLFEPAQAYGNSVYYSAAATDLLIITDADRPTILAYDGIPLTYDGTSLYYINNDQVRYLPDLTF